MKQSKQLNHNSLFKAFITSIEIQRHHNDKFYSYLIIFKVVVGGMSENDSQKIL